MPETAKNIASLQRRLAAARENLLLIQERKAEFVMGTSVSLDHVKGEQRTSGMKRSRSVTNSHPTLQQLMPNQVTSHSKEKRRPQ